MPRSTTSPDLSASHYTRVAGAGEAAKRRSKAPGFAPDASTQPKEIIMFRTVTTAALLALSITLAGTAAQAAAPATVRFGDLNLSKTGSARILAQRVHVAAQSSCVSTISAPGIRFLYYKAWQDTCVDKISRAVFAQIAAIAAQSDRLASR